MLKILSFSFLLVASGVCAQTTTFPSTIAGLPTLTCVRYDELQKALAATGQTKVETGNAPDGFGVDGAQLQEYTDMEGSWTSVVVARPGGRVYPGACAVIYGFATKSDIFLPDLETLTANWP